ncbi:MAG: OmpH family outer membrane protein [Candidatus Eremiobacterota bacterium]
MVKMYYVKQIFCLCFLMLFLSSCKPTGTGSDALPGAPGVGSVDRSVIINLPPFQEAEKKFEDERKKLAAEYSEMAKGLNDKQKSAIQTQFQDELRRIQASIINPLQDKQKRAIEKVAKEKNLSVVLDATVVVCGVMDVTDDVKKVFDPNSKKESKSTTPVATSNAGTSGKDVKQIVGYISQEKLMNISKMRDAQDELYKIFSDMQKNLEKQAKELYGDGAPPASFLANYQKQLDEKKKTILKPVEDEINKVSGEVAKEKGLSIILDDVNVLYGGMDITDDVVTKLE